MSEERKSRFKKVKVTDLPDAKSLRDLVMGMPAGEVKSGLLRWIDEFDLRNVESFRDIAAAYHGIFQLILYTGHAGPQAIKVGEALIKCLSGYRDAYREFVDRELPAELKGFVEDQMVEFKGALQKALPEDVYQRIEQMIQMKQIEED